MRTLHREKVRKEETKQGYEDISSRKGEERGIKSALLEVKSSGGCVYRSHKLSMILEKTMNQKKPAERGWLASSYYKRERRIPQFRLLFYSLYSIVPDGLFCFC